MQTVKVPPMISITQATEKDYKAIVAIGRLSVAETHRASAPPEDLDDYMRQNYNDEAIINELRDPANIYHLAHHDNLPVGFSKIVFNCKHENIENENVTKLDRIYLLKEAQGLKLGQELLNYIIGIAKQNSQSGIWLYTWVENHQAIKFYLKAGFTIIGSHNFQVSKTHFNLNHQLFLSTV